ncbi:MAG: MFS transporter [Ectothiorhodospiraceae bacterium]|nr:MFS transporter [Ectothiorhodospiraceae bacterium]
MAGHAGSGGRGHKLRFSLFIPGLGIAQIASWGSVVYSFPQIANGMADDLGFSRSALYGAASLGILLSGLAAYPVGEAIDRGFGRRLMVGGSILAGLLLVAWSQVQTLALYYLILAGLGLTQAAILYEAAFAVVARREGPVQARHGITALTLWAGFASTVFIPLTEWFIMLGGWRWALAVLGMVNLVLCAGLYAWLIRPAEDAVQSMNRVRAEQPAARSSGPLASAVRMPVFWLIAVSFTAHAATFSVLTYHLYPLLLERGLSAASVVTVLAVIGPAQVVGRVLMRLLAPNASARLLGSLVVLGFPVSVALLGLAPAHFGAFLAVAAIYGAANGVMTIIRGIAVPEMVSRRGYGAINGALTAPSMFARALAPLAAAGLWGISQSYAPVLGTLFAAALLLAAAFWWAALLVSDAGPVEE